MLNLHVLKASRLAWYGALALCLGALGGGCEEETATALDGGDALDAQVDAGAALDSALDGAFDAAADGMRRSAEVEAALARWARLTAEHGDRYWYEEENCIAQSTSGHSTIVQIEGDAGRTVGTRVFERSQCEARVNRFGDFGALTVPQLYAYCERTLREAKDPVTLHDDPAGLLYACYYSTHPLCRDTCGSGYYLRRWGFGTAPSADAAVPIAPAN